MLDSDDILERTGLETLVGAARTAGTEPPSEGGRISRWRHHRGMSYYRSKDRMILMRTVWTICGPSGPCF